MEQIKTWQEAFEKKGLDPNVMPDVSMIPTQYHKSILALFILTVVAEVLNDGWVPDYTDRRQLKYEPWFAVEADDTNKTGVGLAFNGYDCWLSYSSVGVRLCYRDSDTARYAGTQFKELYEDLFLNR